MYDPNNFLLIFYPLISKLITHVGNFPICQKLFLWEKKHTTHNELHDFPIPDIFVQSNFISLPHRDYPSLTSFTQLKDMFHVMLSIVWCFLLVYWGYCVRRLWAVAVGCFKLLLWYECDGSVIEGDSACDSRRWQVFLFLYFFLPLFPLFLWSLEVMWLGIFVMPIWFWIGKGSEFYGRWILSFGGIEIFGKWALASFSLISIAPFHPSLAATYPFPIFSLSTFFFGHHGNIPSLISPSLPD